MPNSFSVPIMSRIGVVPYQLPPEAVVTGAIGQRSWVRRSASGMERSGRLRVTLAGQNVDDDGGREDALIEPPGRPLRRRGDRPGNTFEDRHICRSPSCMASAGGAHFSMAAGKTQCGMAHRCAVLPACGSGRARNARDYRSSRHGRSNAHVGRSRRHPAG